MTTIPTATATKPQTTKRLKPLRKKLAAAVGSGVRAGYQATTPGVQAGSALGGYVGASAKKPIAAPAPAAGTPAAAADPYDLSAKLTPENVKALVDAQTRLQYGGQTQALKQQAAALPGYFTDYHQRLQQLAQGLIGTPAQTGQLGGAYGAGLASLGQLADQLGQGSRDAIAQGAVQQMTDAVTRGGTPSAQVGKDAANAASVRDALLGNMGGLLASQGLTEGTYLANRDASSGPLQLQAQAKLDAALAQLQGDKGAYRTNAVAQLRGEKADRADARQKAKLEAAVFGLDQTKEKDDVATTIAKLKADLKQATADRSSRERQNTQDNTTTLTAAQIRARAQRQAARQKSREDERQDRQDAREKRRESHQTVKETIARIHAYQGDEIPLDPDHPNKGTRAPTPAEVRDRLLHEGFTQRQINQALARLAKANAKKGNPTEAGDILKTLFPGS